MRPQGQPEESTPPPEESSPVAPARPADPEPPGLADFGINAGVVEEIRQRFEVDPTSVDPDWGRLFAGAPAVAPAPSAPAPAAASAVEPSAPVLGAPVAEKHARALRLIHSYRARGHRVADIDPLGGRTSYFPELDPSHYGFGKDDLDSPTVAGDLPGGPVQTLREILDKLRRTYCRTVGVEFTHIQDPGRKVWLQKRMEETSNETPLERADRLRVLERLSAAELFERFLHTKFLGQKRFSLEGAESLIPLLDTLVEDAPSHGVREFVIGMAHRGRLNVLSNILGKSLESIFGEFEDIELPESPFGSGDVKYHKGFSSDRHTALGARVHLSLTANPSHLEAVDPVVEGRTKAKQVSAGDERGHSIVPLLVHGDAAFAGQGIVAETLNLSGLAGYTTGGTIHVVVNNQIGFTTTPAEARSTLYCTDVAKMIQAPIFHVNADDPEAVLHCAKLAFAYRQRFGDDVVIDLVCYRRHGHNEGDEPSFTQPKLYEKIRQRPPVRRLYTAKLMNLGVLKQEDARQIEEDLGNQLQQALQVIKTRAPVPDEPFEPRGPWTGFSRALAADEVETAVTVERLAQVAERLATLPADFNLHPKLAPLLERRRKGVAEDGPIDWALAEALAFGTLLLEGYAVRLSGQDSSRGTFSHRHAVLVDQKTEREYAPLAHLSPNQGRFDVYDSLLSEVAVLGFEYGYSLADPMTLTIWEAQFGDFANGAQVIIDQFISSAHEKWGRMSGLVMLLPHGFEGQGPEHSSARIERFLQLCAEDHMQVANCTTPAQYFHIMRRQMRRNHRLPLVLFTPKSLLRAPFAASRVSDLAERGFQRVIDDALAARAPERVRRVLLCSGKVYYDLLERQGKRLQAQSGETASTVTDVAILRVEEIYPWPKEEVAQTVRRYRQAESVVWVQEEPSNMGAWTFVRDRIEEVIFRRLKLRYAGRPESASPAVGSHRKDRAEQAALVDEAFAGLD